MSAVTLWDTSLLPVRLVVARNPRILPFSQVQVPGKSFKATMAFSTATDLGVLRNLVCDSQYPSCGSFADHFGTTSALLAAIVT